MGRFVLTVMLMGLPAIVHAAEPAALVRARALYNSGSFDAAIDAAAVARRDPQAEDAASLVLARAYLERFRVGKMPEDLTAARAALASVRAALLAPRDQLDLLVGFGQTLFLSEAYGPAADIFDSAIGRAAVLSAIDRSKLLDWWATALDRQAQARPSDQRPPIFTRIVDRMQEELRSDPGSANANYWLVVGARGAGDLDRAWDAAIAAWVRATVGTEANELRTQLDRLVSTALIPERARLRPVREQADAAAALRAEWEQVKAAWK
jgi:hypothetical protein